MGEGTRRSQQRARLALSLGLALLGAVVPGLGLSGPGSLAPAAHAQSPADDARAQAGPFVEQGLKLARKGQYAEAIEQFEEAFKRFPDSEIMHNLARANQELGALPVAYEWFRKALAKDPGYLYAADARDRMSALEVALRRTHARLEVSSVPSQVDVTVRPSVGGPIKHLITPIEGRWVPAGAVEVVGRRAGFQAVTKRVMLEAGVDQKLELLLRPEAKKGFFDLTANVPGATVLLDGEAIGEAPIRGAVRVAGTYAVRVEAEGHQPFVGTLIVEPDAATSLHATLAALTDLGPSPGPGPPSPAPSAPGDGGPPWAVIGGSLAGVGAAAVGAGAVLYALAADQASAPGAPETSAEFSDRESSVRGLETGAIVSLGLGVAMVGVGVWMLVAPPGGGPDTRASVDTATSPSFVPLVAPSENGLHLGAHIRF